MAKISVVISLFCALCYTQAQDGPIVEVPCGKIRGSFRENFYEFKSIPYAEPPIGEKRFEAPIPYTSKWEGIRDATLTPNACMQWDEFYVGKDLLHGEEDCLYLNVFTPNIEGDELYPVVVHIHGGYFMFGSADLYGPERLLKETKLVLVTFNYRLGPLGFLSTGDQQISGNMGLKDQVLAMEWVKENIKMFKGNPENITLTGFSAGGASVHFHLLSKKSEGLFSTAISHSGTAFCTWALIKNPSERAKKLAAHLNCPTDDKNALKICLKEKDAKDIVRAVQIFQPYMYNPAVVFGPVIEAVTSTDSFITENMETIIKEGRSAKVPWIVSYTEDEGGLSAAILMKKDSNGKAPIDSLDEKWPVVAPLMIFYNETVPADQHAAYAENLKRQYLGGDAFSSNTYRKVQKMFTDQLFLIGISKSITLHTEFSETPVYVYHYNRPLPGGPSFIITQRTDLNFGTVHGDDVYIIYKTPFEIASLFTEKEDQMSKNFADLYTSFAKTGVPKYKDIIMPDNRGSPQEWKVLKINDVDDYEIEIINDLKVTLM